MQTILEIFYLRVMGDKVRYQRRQANLSKKGTDPNKTIESLIQEKRRDEAGEVQKQEFIVHSTSWRYEQPGKVILTYVAYSDEWEFRQSQAKYVTLKKLRTVTKKTHKPRSQSELEKQVVSHAMRHIAFLIQTGALQDFESALTPKTRKVFEKLWISLAGKVY